MEEEKNLKVEIVDQKILYLKNIIKKEDNRHKLVKIKLSYYKVGICQKDIVESHLKTQVLAKNQN